MLGGTGSRVHGLSCLWASFRPGIEFVSPALPARFLITGPPVKSFIFILKNIAMHIFIDMGRMLDREAWHAAVHGVTKSRT